MQKIRKNDVVQIIKGKDKGKHGKVIGLFNDSKRALIEGLNLYKKNKRQNKQDQKGGIISIEMPVSVSNLMIFCKHCSKPVRTAIAILKDGSKARICKACKETL